MISSLRLVNFRNYDDCRVDFVPGVNLLLGRNGQGKTNILEALYYLSVLRSFRTSRLQDLRQIGKQFFLLDCRVSGAEGGPLTELFVSQGTERRLRVNGVEGVKATDFITRLTCVAFLPSDLDIVKGSPALRRRFLDILLCRQSPEYLRNLQKCNAVLKCRNIMLRDCRKYPRATVQAYDSQLTASAVALERARLEVVESLNAALKELSMRFFPKLDAEGVVLRYYPGIVRMHQDFHGVDASAMADAYREGLDSSYESDCQNGATRLGPHRGEMVFLLSGRSLTNYGSQGECRSAMLAARFAEVRLLSETRGPDQVSVLVDDVLGELDETRAAAFLGELGTCRQTIMAATASPPGLAVAPNGCHLVEAGRITPL